MITRVKEVTAGDIKRLLLRVYKRYQAGEITENRAYKEAYLLNSLLRAIEVTDLEARIEGIETTLRGSHE